MDSTFKNRREEYFTKLRNNSELLESIMNGNNNSKTLNILLIPSDEKELLLAENFYILMDDLLFITKNCIIGNIDVELSDDNMIILLFTRIIIALKEQNQEEISKITKELNTLNTKKSAQLIFELMTSFFSKPEELMYAIFDKCGFDQEDELSIVQFQKYLEKANEITNNRSNSIIDLSNIDQSNDEQISNFIDFTNEFHSICEEKIYNKNELQRTKKY